MEMNNLILDIFAKSFNFIGSIVGIILIVFLIILYHVILFFIRDRKYIKAIKKHKDPDIVKIESLKEIPLVTIIIPAWNEGESFRECLKSITNLSYPKLKVILNAGGSQETTEIAESFKNFENFKILNQEKGGKLKAINQCLLYVSEGVVYLIDADVHLNDEILLRMLFPITNSQENVVIGGTRPKKNQEDKDIVRYLKINRDLNFRFKFSRYRKTHISGANTCLKYDVIKSMNMFSTDKVYAVEVSQANDILSKGYNIYRLIDYRGRIYTRVPETIREWGKQRIRWSENSLIYAIQENKKSLIKFSILFLLSLYLVFFPFLILIHISFFFIGLYLLLYLYLNKIRKVVFSKIVYKKYFKKLSFLFYVKIFFFTYIEIILNIYTTIELLIFGGKKLKARKNLDYEINY